LGFRLYAFGALFTRTGAVGSLVWSSSAIGCTPATGTTDPEIIGLGALTGPTSNLFTQEYTVQPYDSLVIGVRRAFISFGGQLFTVKQTSY
jgi:hypothetical protein